MTKIISLLILLSLFSSHLAWAGGTNSRIVQANVYEGGENALVDPSFERSSLSSKWVATKLSGTTFTAAVDASNQKKGSQSALLTWTSATGEFCQTTTSIAQTNGMAMVSAMWVKSALTDVSVCANVGGVDIQCNTYSGAGNWQMVPVTYTGPSNGTAVGVCIKNTNSETGTANVDEAFVGSIQSPQGALGQVSQAQWVGSMTINGACSGNGWSTTSTSFTDVTTTGCTYSAAGSLSNPTSNWPGFQVANMPPGVYKVEAVGSFGSGNSSNNASYFEFYDGTNEFNAGSVLASASTSEIPNITGTLIYTTAQTNINIRIRPKANTAAQSATITAASFQTLTFNVYRFPTSSELGYRPDVLPASWSGYHDSISGGCSTSASTFTDPSACTGITLHMQTAQNITCSQSGTGPAISCTFGKTGVYRVHGTITVSSSGAGRGGARVVDGSNTYVAGGNPETLASGGTVITPFDGTYNVSSTGTAIIFKAQLSNNNASTVSIDEGPALTGNIAIQWNVDAAGQGTNSPLLMGSVTSASTGMEHIERASVPSACGSITSESGSWLSSPSHPRTGNCTFTIATGEFSSAPQCWCTVDSQTGAGLGGRTCEIGTSTSSTVLEVGTSNNAGTLTDYAFNVFCMGPH